MSDRYLLTEYEKERLRYEFAGRAMQGLLEDKSIYRGAADPAKKLTDIAVRYADKLMESLEDPNG